MKKFIIYLFVGLVFVVLYFSYATFTVTPEQTVAHYKERWEIEMPIPDEIIHLWSTKSPARGDGEWVTMFQYDSFLLPDQLNDFTKVTKENVRQANGYVNTFINRVQSMYAIQHDDTFKNTIEPYSFKLKLGDYYFHQSENGNFDTITVIYQQLENHIVIFEWHQ